MNKKVKIFSGSSNKDLTRKICKRLNIGMGRMDIQNFSDGEFMPVFKENLRGCTVFIVQSTYPPFDNYWELFQMIDAAKRSSAKEIIPILTYYGYSRQDRKDQPRVGIGSKLIQTFLESAGATRIMTVDLHTDQIGSFFSIPMDQLYASYVFIPYIERLNLDNLIVASPDTGGAKKAKYLSKYFGCNMVLCHKQRSKANKIDEMILIGDVKGKDVVIVDDIIDTGGTLCRAADLMMENGANSVRSIITHPILSGNAYENVEKSSLTELIVTDSVPLKKESEKITVLSIDKLISKAIKNQMKDKSLSELFIN